MHKIGIQSRLILGNTPKRVEIHRIKKMGFQCIDFNLDRFLPNNLIYGGKINDFFDGTEEALTSFFQKYYEYAAEEGVVFSQVHAPYPFYVYGREYDREYMHMVAKKSIAICASLRSPFLIIHPLKLLYQLGRNEEERKNIEFFQSLIPIAQEHNVIICLENLYDCFAGRICEGVCADPYQAVSYIDTLNQMAGEERFAFCFDTGHANLLGKNMKETILTLGRRLQALHIHDNDARGDLHQIPFGFNKKLAGNASTDWNGFIRGLQEIDYKGVLSFETFGALQCFPEELHDSVLRLIVDTGKYFANRLDDCV